MSKRGRRWLIAGAMIIVFLIGIVIAIPAYKTFVQRSREDVLALNLGSLREVIKQYTSDKQKPPQSLQELVDAGYYRQLPPDPMTNLSSTWQPVVETVVISPGKTERGITDVHSGASSMSSKGTTYSTW